MKYTLPLLLIASVIEASSSHTLTLFFKIYFNDGTMELIPSDSMLDNAVGISFTWPDFRIEPDYYPGQSAYALIKPEKLFAKLGLANRITDVERIEVIQGKCDFTIRRYTSSRYKSYSVEDPYKRGIMVNQVKYPAYIEVYPAYPVRKQEMGVINSRTDAGKTTDIMTTMTAGAEKPAYCYIKFWVCKY